MRHIVTLIGDRWLCDNCEEIMTDSKRNERCKGKKKTITLTITREAAKSRNAFDMAKEWGEHYGYTFVGRYGSETKFDDNGMRLDHYDRIYFIMLPTLS